MTLTQSQINQLVEEYKSVYDGDEEVTEEKVKIAQDADAIYREEIANAGLDKTIGQYFAALTNLSLIHI